MKKMIKSVALLKTLLFSLFFILGLCLVSCSQNEISSLDVTSDAGASNSTGTEVQTGNDNNNEDDDKLVSNGFSGTISTGHEIGYEVKSRIPVDSNTLEITLFVGHIPNIEHFFWENENGSILLTDEEREKLDFSIELYDPEHPRHKILVESFDYLSDEYLFTIEYPDPLPEYLTPSDCKIVYASNFKVTLDVKNIIVDEYGRIIFYICQIDRENGYKESFSAIALYYEVFDDEIVFSDFANPVLEYDASKWKY